MTYKNLILLFILIYAAKSLAQDTTCSLQTADKIFYAQKESINAKQLIIESNCSDEIITAFAQEVMDVTGNLPASYFEEKIPGMRLSPQKVSISSLSNFISQKLSLSDKIVIDDLRSNMRNTFLLSSEEQINVSTPGQLIGQNTVSIEIVNPLTSGKQKFWLSLVFKSKVQAFVAKKGIDRGYGALKPEYFVKQEIVTEFPDRLFMQFDRIQHFSLNRAINAGHVLMRAETLELPLVTYGVPAAVVLNNNGIQLNGSATPMKTANFGDYIQLKNPRSNKIITAKVVDFNKVIIQL